MKITIHVVAILFNVLVFAWGVWVMGLGYSIAGSVCLILGIINLWFLMK